MMFPERLLSLILHLLPNWDCIIHQLLSSLSLAHLFLQPTQTSVHPNAQTQSLTPYPSLIFLEIRSNPELSKGKRHEEVRREICGEMKGPTEVGCVSSGERRFRERWFKNPTTNFRKEIVFLSSEQNEMLAKQDLKPVHSNSE